MKKATLLLFAIPILLVQTGCFSIGSGRKSPPPRFTLTAKRPAPQAFASTVVTNNLLVIGRVKASRSTEGNTISMVDADSGRFGVFDQGAFAFPIDFIVDRATRNWLARSNKFGTVVDSSIAPRVKERTMLECWIEQFGLQRKRGKWSAVIELHYLVQYPGGDYREIPILVPTDVDTPIRDKAPTINDVLMAFNHGLENAMEKLEDALEGEE